MGYPSSQGLYDPWVVVPPGPAAPDPDPAGSLKSQEAVSPANKRVRLRLSPNVSKSFPVGVPSDAKPDVAEGAPEKMSDSVEDEDLVSGRNG